MTSVNRRLCSPGRSPLRIAFDALVARLVPLFEAYGCDPDVAAILAENCAGAERDGAKSHGLSGFRATPRHCDAAGSMDGRGP